MSELKHIRYDFYQYDLTIILKLNDIIYILILTFFTI